MKPVVFLIDQDEEYAEFLEAKLIEKYGGQIDLHTITDSDYFLRLFSGQQRAAAALVGEGLYSSSLRQHQIDRIVVLSGRQFSEEDRQRQEPGVVWVNRFSNPATILNEALYGLRMEAADRTGKRAGMAQVIAVTSAIGGSGKTSVALALSGALARSHQRVLYLCTEEIQSFGYHLPGSGSLPLDACRALAKNTSGAYQQLRRYLKGSPFAYLPPMPCAPSMMQIPPDAYVRLVREARMSGDLDVIVLDPGTGCDGGRAALLQESDQVFVLVLQDGLSAAKTEAMLRNMDASSEKYSFVCNRFVPPDAEDAPRRAAAPYTVDTYLKDIPDMSLKALEQDEGLAELTYMLL